MKNFARIAVGLLISMPLMGAPASAMDAPRAPGQVEVLGQTLQLNGEGLRKATIFQVKVYRAGLYLTHRTRNGNEILRSSDPKVVRLTFLRDVTSQQVQSAWKESFEKNCGNDCATLRPTFARFVEKMPGAKDGDVFAYVISKKGIEVVQNGREIANIDDPRFAKLILSTWIGQAPPSIEMKQAMLGLSQDQELSG